MTKDWENTIPWYMTIMSTIVLVALAVFLILNIEWFKIQALGSNAWNEATFQLHIHHLHISMIKRSIGFFSGFAALFIGMAVSFYTLKQTSQIDLSGIGFPVILATSSPGIIAMVLGGYLIVSTVESKDSFPGYNQQIHQQVENEIAKNKPKDKFNMEEVK